MIRSLVMIFRSQLITRKLTCFHTLLKCFWTSYYVAVALDDLRVLFLLSLVNVFLSLVSCGGGGVLALAVAGTG